MKLPSSRDVVGMIVKDHIDAFEEEINRQMRTAGSAACNSCTEGEGKNRRYWNIGISGKVNVATYVHIRDELRKVGWQILETTDTDARSVFKIAVL